MGWTSYHATYYKDNGTVDRKAECDDYFLGGLNQGHFRILKSTMVGSVYYAAMQSLKRYVKEEESGKSVYEDVDTKDSPVFAVVVLTRTDNKDYFNFYYKVMDESMGPCYYDCPLSILKLLSPTDSEWAMAWREKCKQRAEQKKSPTALSKLPIGAQIQFKYGDEVKTYTKHGPAFQFKRPFWYNARDNVYIPVNRIPSDYQVVSM
mgnify:CR=1 FL=1